MRIVRSLKRNRLGILPGLLSTTVITAAILAAPLLAAQDAKPDQQVAASAVPAGQESVAPAVQGESLMGASAVEPVQKTATSGPARLFTINWDAQIKYSLGVRLTGQNDKLINPAANVSNTNLDDGDRAFNRGIMADRGDIFTEIDLTYGNVGVHASAAGWGDAAYLGNSADNSPTTFNAYSVNYNQWAEPARATVLGDEELAGRIRLWQIQHRQFHAERARRPVCIAMGRKPVLRQQRHRRRHVAGRRSCNF